MAISILVEAASGGFCATKGGPLNLSAEAASAAEAVNTLHEKIARRLERGAILIDQPTPTPRPPISILPLTQNPLFDDWLAAVENYRTEQENHPGSGAGEAE
jgi:hypothetical protein